jgi:hypothetical protein
LLSCGFIKPLLAIPSIVLGRDLLDCHRWSVATTRRTS